MIFVPISIAGLFKDLERCISFNIGGSDGKDKYLENSEEDEEAN
jgi:hypothetical protein